MKLGQNVNWNISEQLAKTACQKKIISRFDDRQYAKNDNFVYFFNFKIFQIFFYIVNLDNSNCFLVFAKTAGLKKIYFAVKRTTICEK